MSIVSHPRAWSASVPLRSIPTYPAAPYLLRGSSLFPESHVYSHLAQHPVVLHNSRITQKVEIDNHNFRGNFFRSRKIRIKCEKIFRRLNKKYRYTYIKIFDNSSTKHIWTVNINDIIYVLIYIEFSFLSLIIISTKSAVLFLLN